MGFGAGGLSGVAFEPWLEVEVACTGVLTVVRWWLARAGLAKAAPAAMTSADGTTRPRDGRMNLMFFMAMNEGWSEPKVGKMELPAGA